MSNTVEVKSNNHVTLSKSDWIIGLFPTMFFIFYLIFNFPNMVGIIADLLATGFYLVVLGIIFILKMFQFNRKSSNFSVDNK